MVLARGSEDEARPECNGPNREAVVSPLSTQRVERLGILVSISRRDHQTPPHPMKVFVVADDGAMFS